MKTVRQYCATMLTGGQRGTARAALIATVLGLGALGQRSYAQNSLPPTNDRQVTPAAEDDATVAARIKQALHSDPYFYDNHVDVVMDHGNVILRGFVFSDWDLRNAIRIATQAAGNRKVVDTLSIKEGGRQ